MGSEQLQQAIALARAGNKLDASHILRRLVAEDPQNETAWLWYADTQALLSDRMSVLEECLQHIPTCQPAQKGLAQLKAAQAREADAAWPGVSAPPPKVEAPRPPAAPQPSAASSAQNSLSIATPSARAEGPLYLVLGALLGCCLAFWGVVVGVSVLRATPGFQALASIVGVATPTPYPSHTPAPTQVPYPTYSPAPTQQALTPGSSLAPTPTPTPASPPTPAAVDLSAPYDSQANPSSDIAAALATAKAEHKYVLLDFGANWCPDCVILGKLFEDQNVRPFLEKNFEVVRIDVGQWDRNLDIASLYDNPIASGIPAVVVLDINGKIFASTKAGELANARTATAQDILAYLQKWAPK